MTRSRGGPPPPPTAATRLAGAVHHREQGSQAPFPVSELFPSSSSAPHGYSGGARPPRPTTSAPTKKKQRKFVAPHPRPTAPPGSTVHGGSSSHFDLPRHQEFSCLPPRQQAASTGADLPPEPPSTILSLTEAQFSQSRPSASCGTLGYDDDEYFSSTPLLIFDWTPEYHANDVPASTLQPLMDLLTQDANEDLQLLMPFDGTPSSGGKGGSKRGGNYTHDEDIQLCTSWINIGTNAVVGTDQTSKAYWKRIADDFHKNRTFESDRNATSLEHRFQAIIIKECMKFHGFFEQVERRCPSGVPYQEHLMEAQALYARKSNGKSCGFIHCWLKLRHTEKFASARKKAMPGKSKEKEINLNIPAQSQPVDEGGQDGVQGQEKAVRPPGRKKSKDKMKKSDDGDDEYKELMQNLLAIKAEEHAMKKEMWNKDKAAEEHSRKIEERRLEIDHQRLLWEQEKHIMFCDVSMLDDNSKSYVLTRRSEIAKETLLKASGSSGSIGESASVGESVL